MYMKSREQIQLEVDQILESLDGLKRAETTPFFYTRLMARLDNTPVGVWNQWMAFIARPAVSLGLLFIFLVMNGYLLLNKFSENNDQTAQGSDYVAQQITYFDNNTP